MGATPAIRRLLLALLSLGLAGTSVELLLLGHYEDASQFVPLVLIGAAVIVLAWHVIRGSRATVGALRATMGAFIVAGAVGVALHYRANIEFQLEMDADQSRSQLFWKALHAKAPPALAPGVMVQLGLLGLIYGYRHPAWTGGGE